MKNKKTIFFTFIAAMVLVSACTAASTPTQPVISTLEISQGQNNSPLTEAGVPRVTVEDAKTAFDNGEAIIVDVRSAEAYAEGHIAGAISIPLGEFETNIENVKLDKEKWIITYCT